jgi:hypothetical protein
MLITLLATQQAQTFRDNEDAKRWQLQTKWNGWEHEAEQIALGEKQQNIAPEQALLRKAIVELVSLKEVSHIIITACASKVMLDIVLKNSMPLICVVREIELKRWRSAHILGCIQSNRIAGPRRH